MPSDGRDEAADELHEAGADQVPDAFGVAHDARDQHAGLRRVEVAHRQAHDVRLHALAHVGDRALRGDAEDLRQARTRSPPAPAWPRRPPARSASADRSVRRSTTSSMRYLERGRQHQARQPADEHQRQAERSRRRCAQTSSRASRHAAESDTLFFFGGSIETGTVLRRTRSPVPRTAGAHVSDHGIIKYRRA